MVVVRTGEQSMFDNSAIQFAVFKLCIMYLGIYRVYLKLLDKLQE